MLTTILKWGNSFAIRLSKPFADQLGLSKDSKVEIVLEKDKIIIKKPKPEYDLKKMILKVNDANIHKETDTGTITGKEIW